MKNVKSIYIKLLIAAIAAWIISTTFILSDLCQRTGELEHEMVHASFGAKRGH